MLTIENKNEIIYLFGRTNKAPYIQKITNFRPYFYAENEEDEFKTIDGKKVKKVIVEKPSDVPKEREKYKHFEADIVYVNRYLIDNFYDKEIEKEEIRKLYLDIEIEIIDGFPDIEEAKNQILAITCYDNFLKKYINFAIGKPKKENNGNVSYYWFEKEEEMLNKFLKFIKETNPDVYIGWNIEGFDMPYIINRLKKLKIKNNNLCRLNEEAWCKKDKENFRNKTFGREILDLMWMYKKISQGERESYSLEYISQYELGEGKEKYEGDIKDLYKDFEKFIKYNIRDVELLILLDEKLKLIDFFDAVRRYAKCTFQDVYQNSRINDSLILCFCKNKFVLPSKKHNEDKYVQGGLVFEPKKGVLENVAVLDMASLYPSIIYTFNISPETYGKKEINIDNKYFYSKTKGIIPQIIEKLLEERKKYKKLMNSFNYDSQEYKTYDLQQYSVKIVANGLYGTLGMPSFRLFKKECFETITYTARKILNEVSDVCKKKGFNVAYGDTDSVFIELGNKNIEDVKQLTKEINLHWNEWIRQFGIEDHILKIQFEKLFKTIFFSGVKKRYAGIICWHNDKEINKIQITGYENRRADSPQIARDFQKKLFEMILRKETKEEIDNYIEQFKKDIKTKYSPEQIALPIGISNNINNYKNLPIHIRASKLANKRHNAGITKGDRIKYIYVKTNPKGYKFENVIAFKDKMWDGYEIDYDRIIERLINTKVETIYRALGWKKEVGTNLFSF